MPRLQLEIDVTGQQQAGRALDQTASRLDKFKSGLSKASAGATIAGAGIIAFAKTSADAASEVQQAMGGVESVFGKNADTVKQWSKDAADSVGLAQDEYANAASKFGAQFKNMGLSQDQVLDGTGEMIKLGADLAATFGGSTQEAVDALSAAFRGEADPAERYGLALSQTAVNAELAKRGQDKLTGSALQQAKAAAIMRLATQQAGAAQGQFAREADTAAGSQQRATAQWRNAQAALGQALLPILMTIGSVISRVSGFISQNTGLVRTLGAVVLGTAAAVKVLNVAMNANPIARVLMLVGALAAGFVALYQKSETFRNIVNAVWNSVRVAAEVAWNAIRTVVTAVVGAITAVVRATATAVTSTWAAVRNAVVAVWNAIAGAARAVWSAILSVIRSVAGAVTSTWAAVRNAVVAVWNAIAGAARAVWSAILSVIRSVAGAVTSTWAAVRNAVVAVWNAIAGAARTVWSTIGSVIGGVVTGVKTTWNAITAYFSGLFNGVKDTASTIWSALSGVITGAWDAAKAIWNTVSGFFSGLFNGLTMPFRLAWGTLSGVITGVVSVIQNIWSGISGFFSGLWSGIESVFNNTIGRIISAVAGAVDRIKSLVAAAQAQSRLVSTDDMVNQWKGSATVPLLAAGDAGPVRRTAAPTINITVNGAFDPDATARQIRTLLTSRTRRMGGIEL